VRRRAARDKARVNAALRLARAGAAGLLDFALPPRCPGCALVVDSVDSFCVDCWGEIDWLRGGCERCGHPLEATEAEQCGRCLGSPPPFTRIRAVAGYDDYSRGLVMRLKYGRKVALARTLARFMAPLAGRADDALIVPVPLHRWRLWARGFNQSLLIAAEIARRSGARLDRDLLVRKRATRPLKGMNPGQRAREVGGAFAIAEGRRIEGRRIILVDDVLTTGSTAEACARVLRKAGAGQIELLVWARVVRGAHLLR
jgi:ComF family protein